MYNVCVYVDNDCILNAPFELKDAAIKYFNWYIERNMLGEDYSFCDRIEIVNNGCVIFDYEFKRCNYV